MKTNPNTSNFWDKKIISNNSISKRDFITKDRITRIVNWIDKIGGNLLDIGLGYGYLESMLNKKIISKLSLFGIDISLEGLVKAKKKYRGSYVLASAENIPFRSSFFNCACILEVLEHLFKNEANTALKEVNRVLNKDSFLIVSVPLFDKIYPNHPSGHVRLYTPSVLLDELNNNGFRILRSVYLTAFSSSYGIKKIINQLFNFKRPNNLIILAQKK